MNPIAKAMARRRSADRLDAQLVHARTVLADEFDWSEATASIFTTSVGDALRSGERFEFVCDDPRSARFRLKRDDQSADPFALRVAFYPVADPAPHGPGIARAWALTARLAESEDR